MSSESISTSPLSFFPAVNRVAALVLAGLGLSFLVVLEPKDAKANGACSLTGNGDSASPYLVADEDDLRAVGVTACGLDAHYRQTANIVLDSSVDFEPIGSFKFDGTTDDPHSSSNPFSGNYDGGNFTIQGLTVDHSAGAAGLFAYLTGTVSNVHIDGGSVTANYLDTNDFANHPGGGALVGRLLGTVESSSSSASVIGNGTVGGLVGHAGGGEYSISDSFATGSVQVILDDTAQGALAGDPLVEDPAIDVRWGGVTVGGLVGQADASASGIVDSHATGSVTSEVTEDGGTVNTRLGGLVGNAESIPLSDSYATGNVTSTTNGESGDTTIHVGGLVGRSFTVSFSSIYATGEVAVTVEDVGAGDASLRAGGLVGHAGGGPGGVTDANAHGDVSVTSDNSDVAVEAGGLVGRTDGASRTLSNTHATGTVTVSGAAGTMGSSIQAGGLVGVATQGPKTIQSSSSSGAVEVTGDFRSSLGVGGLVGAGTGTLNIDDSLADGGVDVTNEGTDSTSEPASVAGLVGYVGSTANLNNSYALGAVTADFADWDTHDEGIGGFVGATDGDLNATNSYSTGLISVNADGDAEGFLGRDTGSGTTTVTESFWDVNTSGLSSSVGGTGKTTAEMTAFSTFDDASWSIVGAENIADLDGTTALWGICSGVNSGYPFLHWQTDSAGDCVVETNGTSSGGSRSDASREREASSPAIHLDVQGVVGQPVEGTTVVTGGQGLAPGSTKTLVVRSTPQTLATATTNNLGNFSTQVSLPALPPGSHSVTLTAIASDGSTLSLVKQLSVGSSGIILAISEASGTRVGGLAATGPSETLMWGALGTLGLLLAGVLMATARGHLRSRSLLER